jgi:hypothetical protein
MMQSFCSACVLRCTVAMPHVPKHRLAAPELQSPGEPHLIPQYSLEWAGVKCPKCAKHVGKGLRIEKMIGMNMTALAIDDDLGSRLHTHLCYTCVCGKSTTTEADGMCATTSADYWGRLLKPEMGKIMKMTGPLHQNSYTAFCLTNTQVILEAYERNEEIKVSNIIQPVAIKEELGVVSMHAVPPLAELDRATSSALVAVLSRQSGSPLIAPAYCPRSAGKVERSRTDLSLVPRRREIRSRSKERSTQRNSTRVVADDVVAASSYRVKKHQHARSPRRREYSSRSRTPSRQRLRSPLRRNTRGVSKYYGARVLQDLQRIDDFEVMEMVLSAVEERLSEVLKLTLDVRRA